MSITRRNALTGATAAVAVASLPIAAMATTEPDAELIALGRRWIEAYGKWIGTEGGDSTLLKRATAIEDRMAEIPAHSPSGALVKLRVAAESLRLMGDLPERSGVPKCAT